MGFVVRGCTGAGRGTPGTKTATGWRPSSALRAPSEADLDPSVVPLDLEAVCAAGSGRGVGGDAVGVVVSVAQAAVRVRRSPAAMPSTWLKRPDTVAIEGAEQRLAPEARAACRAGRGWGWMGAVLPLC